MAAHPTLFEPADLPQARTSWPTPHGDALARLAANTKLDEPDRPAVERLTDRYCTWVAAMDALDSSGEDLLVDLTVLLNAYKRTVELTVWDSPRRFLHRQRGQLKLDSTVLEEFCARLADPRLIPALDGLDLVAGPHRTFTGLQLQPDGTVNLTTKDEDFALGRRMQVVVTAPPDQPVVRDVFTAAATIECKTNLDKTHFQGIRAAARDLKAANPNARCLVAVEWLDMGAEARDPVDQVVVLRGRRAPWEFRSDWGRPEQRVARRDEYLDLLDDNPIRVDRVAKLVEHLAEAVELLRADRDPVHVGWF